ncbi:MAG: type II toxin-antitoxin system RelE/ParE family toxin [Planctomycetes bacterium]|nr:type II toxin-antitoxin system RelE/ParE family toxin [Planctomycetota bacterium]
MRYTVIWVRGVRERLTTIWLDATDREAITKASHAIDVELAVDPSRKGSPLREGLRVLEIPPLRVLYSVQDADRIVEVLSIRSILS